jgi:hypothetical protein
MKRCVDRLTVLDGVIVAIGWCEGPSPEIVVRGMAPERQRCQRFDRPDVESYLGETSGQRHGFRIAALVEGLDDYSFVAVRFADGSVSRVESRSPEDRLLEVLKRFLAEIESAPGGASLIELGSRARSGNTYTGLFPSIAHYTGVDIVPGENVDVVADLHVLSKSIDRQYDFAFSMSVFEHLLMPWVVAVELNKVLVTGGLAFIQSHPAWPLHDEPWDFFRFSRDAWTGLFNPFTGFEIVDSAYGIEGRTVPVAADSGSLQGMDMHRTFLATACVVRKTSEPKVDWSCDPRGLYPQDYPH